MLKVVRFDARYYMVLDLYYRGMKEYIQTIYK